MSSLVGRLRFLVALSRTCRLLRVMKIRVVDDGWMRFGAPGRASSCVNNILRRAPTMSRLESWLVRWIFSLNAVISSGISSRMILQRSSVLMSQLRILKRGDVFSSPPPCVWSALLRVEACEACTEVIGTCSDRGRLSGSEACGRGTELLVVEGRLVQG